MRIGIFKIGTKTFALSLIFFGFLTNANAAPPAIMDTSLCPSGLYLHETLSTDSNGLQTLNFACIKPGTKELYLLGGIVPDLSGTMTLDHVLIDLIDRSSEPNIFRMNFLQNLTLEFPEYSSMELLRHDPVIRVLYQNGIPAHVGLSSDSMPGEIHFDLSDSPNILRSQSYFPSQNQTHDLYFSTQENLLIEQWSHQATELKSGMRCLDRVTNKQIEIIWTFKHPRKLVEVKLWANERLVLKKSLIKKYNFDLSPYDNFQVFRPLILRSETDLDLDAAFDCFDHLQWQLRGSGKEIPDGRDRYDANLIRLQLNETR